MNTDDLNEEKKNIDRMQEEGAERIVDADEAADTIEGMDLRENNIFEDVAEDRNETPADALDIPAEDIVQ